LSRLGESLPIFEFLLFSNLFSLVFCGYQLIFRRHRYPLVVDPSQPGQLAWLSSSMVQLAYRTQLFRHQLPPAYQPKPQQVLQK